MIDKIEYATADQFKRAHWNLRYFRGDYHRKIRELKLQKHGWFGRSVGMLSDYDIKQINKYLHQYKKKSQYRILHFDKCDDINLCIGVYYDWSMCIWLNSQKKMNKFIEFLDTLPNRSEGFVIQKRSHDEISKANWKKAKKLCKGHNYLIIDGNKDITFFSFSNTLPIADAVTIKLLIG